MKEKRENKIRDLLSRGVEEVIVKKNLEKRLKSGEKLRVKFGIDPTSADLHLGHSISLFKLKQFQDLGHQVVFLIGDFTASIGDPSGRADMRKILTESEIKQNMKDYVEQAGRILDMSKAEIRYNSEWYKKKGADFLMDLSSRFTYARLIERDEFKKRIKQDIDVSMLELLYPLLQGYDSVVLKADVEIGGTDQKFNLVFARKVQRKYKQPQQDIMTLSLLIGTDGVRKMSKSYENYIKLTEEPSKMFGQIMSIPDLLIWHYFKLLTNLPLREIELIKDKVCKTLTGPKEAKLRLAREIVELYHGKDRARIAEEEFIEVFSKKEIPAQIKSIKITPRSIGAKELLVKCELTKSLSEAQRLIEQGAVSLDKQIVKDWRQKIIISKPTILKVGKYRFIRLIP